MNKALKIFNIYNKNVFYLLMNLNERKNSIYFYVDFIINL